ncbi:MAG TPA: deoxyribonuclease IV [Solirubrobacteraceae bacterium]|nr:deoxyribonuclease IV [Solirubrobacteraceae bacterium]
MLIGAHVSPAGGLPKAIDRGVERGCRAIQIFNQSPRQWKPTAYREEDIVAFREAMAASPVDAVLIHAVYLLNCASDEPGVRAKTLESLAHSLRVGHAIGASAVILHPGSAKKGDVGEAIARAGETIAQALGDSEGCELHLENTAGAGGTLGRSFDELARLLEAAGGGERIGVCLDSCHLLASGYDIRTPRGMGSVLRECSRKIGRGRVRSLHLNDSQTPLGSNRDRHANVGAGELGDAGCAAFLSAPALQKLPCVLETPGERREGPGRKEIALAMRLRERGIARRRPATV